MGEQGRRYSTLNSDVFYRAHGAFFMGAILTAEDFGDGLTEDDKDFQVYWDHMRREVLENSWATRQVLDLSMMPKHPSLQWIPDPMWAEYLKVFGPFVVWLTVGARTTSRCVS
ncbi:oxygenase MpaB family protein [Candidatus Mycolicibacterium alkanivorans]|uniref:oxygenase MpaB family protein n=1 Tax=Candidatus Mycolicibacterium alkanivorans TaxID=2954114 RepID=UPI0035582A2E